MGAAPGAALIQQADLASREVYAACGVPLTRVVDRRQKAPANAKASAACMHSTIAPLARIVAEELSEQVRGRYFGLSFDAMYSPLI